MDEAKGIQEMYTILDQVPSVDGVNWIYGLMSHHGYVNYDKISEARLRNLLGVVDLALEDPRKEWKITATIEVGDQKHVIEETFADKLGSLQRQAQAFLERK